MDTRKRRMGTKRINARIRSGKGSEREGTSRRKEDRRPPPPLQNIMPGNSHFEGSVGRPGSSSSASSLESGELEPYAGLPVHPVHGNGGSYAEFRLGRDPYPQLVRKLAEGPWSGGRDMANSERLATFQSMTTSVDLTKLKSANHVVPDHQVGPHAPLVSPPTNGHLSSDAESMSTGEDSRTSPSFATVCDNLPRKSPPPDHLMPPTVDCSDQRLLNLQERTRYEIIQRNGQRICGPPPGWVGEPPSKGSEIFVGRVPRDCFEDELFPVFEKMGQIYELRLMMDFSGSNRGFFFVRYTRTEDAKRACRELDNYEIRPNKRLGVLLSVDNRKLWISGIPNNITAEEIKAEMRKLTNGVTDVILYRSQTDKTKPRKYAFVEYESHRAAALARRRLVPSKIMLKGQEIEKVDWAEPEDEVDEDIMSTVKILFVRNLPEAVTEDILKDKFNEWSEGAVQRVRKTKDYAFVHFETRTAAEMAKSRAMGEMLDGEPLEVEWSKPVDKNIYNTRKHLTKVLSSSGNCLQQQIPSAGYPFPTSTITMRGAPGTPPPKNLIRKLGQGNSMGLENGHPGNLMESALFQSMHSNPHTPVPDPLIKALYELKLSQASHFNGLAAAAEGNGMSDVRGINPFYANFGIPGYPPFPHPPIIPAPIFNNNFLGNGMMYPQSPASSSRVTPEQENSDAGRGQ